LVQNIVSAEKVIDVERAAEVAAFRVASRESRSVAISVEAYRQILQQRIGCGWGLGNHVFKKGTYKLPESIFGCPADMGRTEVRLALRTGNLDVIVVPETAFATASLLIEGFDSSRANVEIKSLNDSESSSTEHKLPDSKKNDNFTIVVGGEISTEHYCHKLKPGQAFKAIFLDDHRCCLGFSILSTSSGFFVNEVI
jgi:hypothetical protein